MSVQNLLVGLHAYPRKTYNLNASDPVFWIIIAVTSVFVVLVLIVVMVAMVKTFGGMRATAQLVATGLPAEARVLAVRDLGGSIQMGARLPRQRLQIDLEVIPQNGQPPYRTSTVQMISMLNLARLQPGATVSVRYDPTNPTRVALVA